jgi:molybdate transport system ATP-binding protein
MTLAVSIQSRLSPDFELNVHFSAAPGITMVFGESGSGKTTMLKCLAGLRRPDRGRLVIGEEVLFDADRHIHVAVRHRALGYVFQHLALFPHMTVEQNLQYGLTHLDRREKRARIQAIAESFRIGHLLSRRPDDISGGERQRAALARSLVTNPRLLLLDEPLAALDHVTQSRIIEDLRVWNAAHSIPILYVTHSHREVFALGEHVLVLRRGTVLAEGSPHEVLDSPAHEMLAQLAGFENVLDAQVESSHPDSGTMRCRLAGTDIALEAPLTRAHPGSAIRIAIRAGDILLATEEPRGLSARNVFSGAITSVQREGATVILIVQAGRAFEVHLTPGALAALHLQAGQQVWLVIKTHSCRVVSTS